LSRLDSKAEDACDNNKQTWGSWSLMSVAQIRKPYLLLIGDMENPRNAKTAFGLRDWARKDCLGQLRFTSQAVDIGLPQMSLREAANAGARTLVIGIAPQGGQLPEGWRRTLLEALDEGLDLAAGLHQRLADIPEILERATLRDRAIHDVRHSTSRFSVGTGKRRTGRRLLTVGTDCALGKKYTALALARAMRAKGLDASFRATGQTGILISGQGVAVDAVVADFISGTAEGLSPANAPEHWDVIEGQGSLFHPAYAGVSLGLLHGSQPDALVLCHDPTRKTLNGFPHVPVVPLKEAVSLYLSAARLTNPAPRFVGVSLNTSELPADQAEAVRRATAHELQLPCVDPIRNGVEPIVAELESFHAS
jgi:uncharacterized NAD-dependent epimerase/dehydratase family protein